MAQVVTLILFIGLAAGVFFYTFGFTVLYKSIKTVPSGMRLLVFAWLMLYVGMGLWFGRLERPTTLTQIDTSAFIQIGSVFFALSVVLFKLMQGQGINNLKGSFLFLAIYSLLGVLLSPISPVPALSAFKAGSLLVVVLVSIVAVDVVGRKHSGRILLNTSYVYLGVLVFLALVGGILFPEITHRVNKGLFGMMLVGWPALNSNSLSFVAAVIAIVGFRRMFEPEIMRYKIFYSGVFITGLSVLFLAQGRTSIVGFFVGAIFLTFTIQRMRWVRSWMAFGGITIFFVFMLTGSVGDWVDTVETYLRRGSDDESLRTLSGRTEGWKAGWEIFLSSPVFGYGFYAAEKLGIAAHSAYLLVLINSGIAGFVFWFAYVYWALFGALKDMIRIKFSCITEEQRFTAELSAILIILFLRTITGSDLTTHHYSTMIFIAYLINRMALKKYPVNDDDVDATEPKEKKQTRILQYKNKQMRVS